MILLRANQELKLTFEKLIETMKAPVKWTGIFAVVDDYMILQGQVRSLFFHFDSKKVNTNIIDIPVKEDEVWDIMNNPGVRNTINMILYAFGKWGNISGLRVDKDYAQLNQLFGGIMREVGIKAEYTKDHFRFFKNGIRITYEDVIQAALEGEEEPVEEESAEESSGLWHKLLWKKKRVRFSRMETTLSERIKKRIGNNFYMIGYLCPDCQKKLHMAVYPMGKEFRIETEEGGVFLARVCACDDCNCFYTPRPNRLLMEGDIYIMPFEEDRKAYEDYLELLGRSAERVSNSNFNRYADRGKTAGEKEESLEELYQKIETLSEEELDDMEARIDEVFFPDTSTKKYEKKVREKAKKIRKERTEQPTGPYREKTKAGRPQQKGEIKDRTGSMSAPVQAKIERDISEAKKESGNKDRESRRQTGEAGDQKSSGQRESFRPTESSGPTNASRKYEARLSVIDRLSDRQMKDLQRQIETDTSLLPEEKESFIDRIRRKKQREKVERLAKKVDNCEDKTYAVTKRVEEEVREEEEIPAEEKETLLEKLARFLKRQGEKEVREMMEKMPRGMDRAAYRRFTERLGAYTEVDLSPYEEQLKASRDDAERQEIAHIVKHARKNTRADLAALANRLREGKYAPDLVEPYLTQIRDKLREMDEAAIDKILEGSAQMSFAEGKEAYDSIAQGEFLPELKVDALKMLEKRLSKIKADESELLVKKLMSEYREAGITENDRHHYYPARKALMGQATEEETAVIDFALASYAAGRGPFEYPVLVVDTSRNGSGKEGMILTPDHLYYSTLLSAYGIDISSIDKVTASTGLLNRGLYVHQGNGTKTKLPYAVETKELPVFAKVLDEFIRYLREKPDSRKVEYLAKEKHETICCFRCGTVYKGGNICPKCGYKNNG